MGQGNTYWPCPLHPTPVEDPNPAPSGRQSTPKPNDPWLAQFARSVQAQEREMERRSHVHKKYGSMVLF